MLNYIWSAIMLLCIVFFGLNPNGSNFATVLFSSIEKALSLTLSLGGIMCFWSGIMRIAEDAGLCESFSRLLHPLLRPFFPNLKKNGRALNFITMNIAANFLGMGNAATPLGISAMEELEREASLTDTASDEMCMLVILNCASLQFVPSTVIGLRAGAGASTPTDIIPCVWLTSICSLVASVALFYALKRYFKYE